MDVEIIHNHVPACPAPWRWETPNVPVTDPRYRGRPNFSTVEEAETDAKKAGHRVTGVRE
jgi:hypothetical protein